MRYIIANALGCVAGLLVAVLLLLVMIGLIMVLTLGVFQIPPMYRLALALPHPYDNYLGAGVFLIFSLISLFVIRFLSVWVSIRMGIRLYDKEGTWATFLRAIIRLFLPRYR